MVNALVIQSSTTALPIDGKSRRLTLAAGDQLQRLFIPGFAWRQCDRRTDLQATLLTVGAIKHTRVLLLEVLKTPASVKNTVGYRPGGGRRYHP